jgi:PAS domain S-box-containing protein
LEETLQSTLYRIAKNANSNISVQDLYKFIHQSIGKFIDANNFYIAIYNWSKNLISLPYFVDEIDIYHGPYQAGKGLTEYVIRTGQPLLLSETKHKQLIEEGDLELVGPPSKIWLGVPLKSKDYCFGAIVVQHYSNEHAYNEKDMELLMFVANQVALFIEKKREEERLKESEIRYRTLFETARDAILTMEEGGRIIDCNSKALHMFGVSKEKIIGTSLFEYSPDLQPDGITSKEKMTEKMNAALLEGPQLFEWLHINHDNIPFSTETFLTKVNVSGNTYLQTIVRDISEKKELMEKLSNAEKMEIIGCLAGCVAHDLNNVLGGIVSYPDLLLLKLPDDSPLKKYISSIKQSGLKAAAIVQDLLTLTRRGVEARDVVNLNDILTNYLLSPEYEKLKNFHPMVDIRIDMEGDLLNIEGSAIHLTKTVMNLISNAAEAMPEGGDIIITTKNEYLNKSVKGFERQIEEGDYVLLTVTDEGIGICPEDQKKIFEPFYSKKEMGVSGTGLGMTVILGTVKDHNGCIQIKSDEGKGTTFKLYFPTSRAKMKTETFNIPVEDYIGSNEKVLVVDSILMQREIATNLLTTLGYSVNSVASGELAVEYIKKNPVDIIILDLAMTSAIDGVEINKQIRQLQPGIGVVGASGMPEINSLQELKKFGIKSYIQKPYTLKKIGLAVRKELD